MGGRSPPIKKSLHQYHYPKFKILYPRVANGKAEYLSSCCFLVLLSFLALWVIRSPILSLP